MTEGMETRPQAPSHVRHTQFRTFRQILCKFNKDITEREREEQQSWSYEYKT